MPLSYRIDRDSGVILSRGTGVVTDRDMIELFRATIFDHSRGSPYRELCDLRDADEVRIDDETMNRIVDFLKAKKSVMRFARIACISPREYFIRISMIFEACARDVPFEFVVFGDIGRAASWLGLDAEVVLED